MFRHDLSVSSVRLSPRGSPNFESGIPADRVDFSAPREMDPGEVGWGTDRRTWENHQQAGEEEELHRWWLSRGCATQANFFRGKLKDNSTKYEALASSKTKLALKFL